MVEDIDLGPPKEYDPIEVFVDSKDLDNSEDDSRTESTLAQYTSEEVDPGSAQRIKSSIDNNNVLDKLCTPYVGSKSTRVVRRNKSMIPTTSKLEEVHADLWGPHDPSSQSGSIYAIILMCKHTQKTWTLYLQEKDDFIDAFQAWLPWAEAESGCSMKIFGADGEEEFISHKLRTFCDKRGILIKYTAPYVYEKNRLAERGWCTIITIKDSILIDNRLPNGFWVEAMEIVNYL